MINLIKFRESDSKCESTSNSISDLDELALDNFIDRSFLNQLDNLDNFDLKKHSNKNLPSYQPLSFKKDIHKFKLASKYHLKEVADDANETQNRVFSFDNHKLAQASFARVNDRDMINSLNFGSSTVFSDQTEIYAPNYNKHNVQPMCLNPYYNNIYKANYYTPNPYYSNLNSYQPCVYPSITNLPILCNPMNFIQIPYGVSLVPGNPYITVQSQDSSHCSSLNFKPKTTSNESIVMIEGTKNAIPAKKVLSQTRQLPSKRQEERNLDEQPKKKQLNMRIVIEKGNVAEYINSQKGSKKLQCILEGLCDDDPDVILIFDHIFPYLGKISNHNFGNYFCQALFKKIPFSKRQTAWKFYNRRNFTDYASHQFGNHSIQALIDAVNTPLEENYVISQLEKHYENLAFSSNGCYILQRVLTSFQLCNCQSLIAYMISKFRYISCNTIASNLLKKYIKVLSDPAHLEYRKALVECLERTIQAFINDMQGSQVIISIISEWNDELVNDSISGFVRLNFIENLLGWHSRTVVNKCLQVEKNKVMTLIYKY